MNNVEFPCIDCGGTIRLTNGKDRKYLYHYTELSIPDDFKIHTCDNCGELYFSPALVDELNNYFDSTVPKKLLKRKSYFPLKYPSPKSLNMNDIGPFDYQDNVEYCTKWELYYPISYYYFKFFRRYVVRVKLYLGLI